MTNEVIIALIGAFTTIITTIIAYFEHRKAKKEADTNTSLLQDIQKLRIDFEESKNKLTKTQLKVTILDRLAELAVFNELKNAADRIFEQTKADSFIILYATNGSHLIRSVSVSFGLQKNPSMTAPIIRYKDVEIDDSYRAILKTLEQEGKMDFHRSDMEAQILKDFFTLEGINTIKLNFIDRRNLDEMNDIIIFCTIGSYKKEDWTEIELATINSEIEGSIKPIIRSFL
jgi:hypothetical protein